MSLILQELGIVVAMQQPNPNLVTAEFLKLSGIIPLDWQLARQPVNNDNISQLFFTNGVSISAEPNRIMFGEVIGEKDLASLTVAVVAQKYLDIFKQAKYQAIGINIRSYSPQADARAATQFVNHQLLADGSWQNFGTAPMQAALDIIYTLADRQLNLEVKAASMQFTEEEVMPIILFSGNFGYNLSNGGTGDTLATAQQVLANWQTDLTVYQELVTERFLGIPRLPALLPNLTDIAIGRDDLGGMEILDAPKLSILTTA
jgi:hypothetical protein